MEIFEFCIEIVRREAIRFNIGNISTVANQLTAATANDINYDIAHNRCAYVYRCGASNIAFAADCFSSFMIKYEGILSLFSAWKNCTNPTLSSITKGPALDYIAFLLSFKDYALFRNVNIISKYGAWRNTVNITSQIVTEGYFEPLSNVNLANVQVIQADPFSNFSDKIKEPLFSTDVLMMIKSIKLLDEENDQVKVSNALMDMFSALKPGAILFCIETKPVTALITAILLKIKGTFLFSPTEMNTKLDFDCPESYKAVFGCPPVISARGVFFVWQKSKVSCVNSNEIAEYIKSCLNFSDQPSEKEISHSDKLISNEYKNGNLSQNDDVKGLLNSPNPDYMHCNSSILSLPSRSSDVMNDNNNFTETSIQELAFPLSCKRDMHDIDPTNRENHSQLNTGINAISSIPMMEILPNQMKNSLNKMAETKNPINGTLTSSHLDSKSKNQHLIDISYTATEIPTSSVHLINEMPAFVLKEDKSPIRSETINSEKIASDCFLLNESSRSQISDSSDETDVAKIVTLTNRITKLTVVMNELLQKDVCNHSTNPEEIHPYSVPNYATKCFHDLSHSPVLESSCLHMDCGKKSTKSCSNHLCQQSCLQYNQYCCSSVHKNDCHASKNCSTCCNGSSSFNSRIDSIDTPRLVIPLNKLSKDVISQIISSFSKE